MKINLKQFNGMRTILALWPILIFSAGCFSDNSPVKRPVSTTQSVSETSTLELVTYYRNQKYPMVIKSAQALLKSEENNWEARFFLGLAYYNYGDIEAADTTFSSIPEKIRHNMVDSCLELQGLNSNSEEKRLSTLAMKFFPDCLKDLKIPKPSSQTFELNDDAIKNYGQLYDASIAAEDDPDLRRLKELEFLKKHRLTEDQLTEITARYLELITEE